MISSDGQCSISRYAGIGRQPLPIDPLKEILKKEFLVATKRLYKRVCLAIRLLVSWFFGLLGATYAIYTALFYFLTDGQTLC